VLAAFVLLADREGGYAMEMFLMGLCLSLLGVAVSAVAFGAATRDVRAEGQHQAKPKLQPAIMPTQFFVDAPARGDSLPSVPLEVLLLQLERHVRLEQAAAESFLMAPTPQSLHSRSSSPLVH
jgi:hypothetical protein